jgi:hypothetical protein
MTQSFKRKLTDSASTGACISLGLFLVSWWTHTFDFLVFPQFPGFFLSSLLWGFPGFSHVNPQRVRGASLFPYTMVFFNMLFYGILTYIYLSALNRSGNRKDNQGI